MSASLPDRVLADRLIVLSPAGATEPLLAPIEVMAQEHITGVSLPISEAHQIAELRPLFAGRVDFGVHGVRNHEDADRALSAGASFVLLGRADEALVAHVRDAGVAVLPPALTPTEVQRVWDLGVTAVQVTPGDAFGGGYAEQLRALVPEASLVPSGSVGAYSVRRWLLAGAPAVCLDDALTGDAFTGGELSDFRERCQSFVSAVTEAAAELADAG